MYTFFRNQINSRCEITGELKRHRKGKANSQVFELESYFNMFIF